MFFFLIHFVSLFSLFSLSVTSEVSHNKTHFLLPLNQNFILVESLLRGGDNQSSIKLLDFVILKRRSTLAVQFVGDLPKVVFVLLPHTAAFSTRHFPTPKIRWFWRISSPKFNTLCFSLWYCDVVTNVSLIWTKSIASVFKIQTNFLCVSVQLFFSLCVSLLFVAITESIYLHVFSVSICTE